MIRFYRLTGNNPYTIVSLMEENVPAPQAASGNRNLFLIGLFVVIVLGVLGGIFVMNKSKVATTPTPQVVQATPTVAKEQGAVVQVTEEASPSVTGTKITPSAEKTFNVTASSFKFSPTTITVKKGDTVKVVLANAGGNHNFVIDEFNAKTKIIGNGETDTISFVADKSGTYEYYCAVGNHRQMGMVGKLIVQ